MNKTQPNGSPSAKKSKSKPFSLKTIIFAFTVIAAVVPTAIYGYISYNKMTDQVTESTRESLVSTSRQNSRYVQSWLESHAAGVHSVAVSPEINLVDPERSRQYLVRANKEFKAFRTFNATDALGMQFARSTPDKMIPVGDREYFKKPMAGKKTHIESVVSRTNNKPIIVISVALKDQNDTAVGTLAGLADIEAVANEVTGGKIGQTGFSYLIDKNAQIILAHPNVEMVSKKVGKEFLEKINGITEGQIISTVNDKSVPVRMTANSAGGPFVLISEITSAEVDKKTSDIQNSVMISIASTFAMALVISLLLTRLVSLKINRLTDLTIKISKSTNIAEIVALEKKIEAVGGAMELRQIAASIRRLTESVKMAIRSL